MPTLERKQSFNALQSLPIVGYETGQNKKNSSSVYVIICPTQSALYKIYHQSQLFLVLFIEVFRVVSSYLINISPILNIYQNMTLGNKYLDEIFIFMMIAA